jgi:hypothetical protein
MATITVERVLCPVAHVDDQPALKRLLAALHGLHGPGYGFGVGRWEGETVVEGRPGLARYWFVVESTGATVTGAAGDRIRGLPPIGPYAAGESGLGVATGPWQEPFWPGDVLCLEPGTSVAMTGAGSYFEVETKQTAYVAPRAVFLRYLPDKPGGCAAYPGAFRREALPPIRAAQEAEDQRGVNRVNEHTLDMRIDRQPPPSRHYHGPVPTGAGQWVNHSEIAIVLPRTRYGLPEIEGESQGRIVVYPRPDQEPAEVQEMVVRPGHVVVTPATADGAAGHCFANAFATLIAIPGFVSPYRYID